MLSLSTDLLIIERPPCHGGAQGSHPVLLNFGTVFLAEQLFWTGGLVEKLTMYTCPTR